ncbi:MAG: serine hydrolase [Bacteroidia bacterium]|jgi:beta-glucosidase-like glycosyl hydrolase/CubicO group peptidase (beta-lactamase class C family)|nr:serine hydrolase [Bacteroidia bacterium]
MSKRIFLMMVVGCLMLLKAQAQINWSRQNTWVDSVYDKLTTEQRIAQLIMLAAFSNRDSNHIKELECAVREQKIGGIIFFKGNPHKQAQLTNYYQSVADVPLLIGIDAEWGLAMRLDSVMAFPRQMVLGAARNEKLAYEMGLSVGKQCKRMGIHINFAPVVDVNNNPLNPVINDRSFGENKYWVAKLGSQYAKGLQNNGVIACAKHFPGHGDTETDSHYSLPVVNGNRKRLDSLELYPFKTLIEQGVMAVMTAHLNVPALDTTSQLPSSLSKTIITQLLKEEMGFEGLVVTDALNMKGVTEFYKPGEVTAKALAAGNDIMEFVEDVGQSISMIKYYMEQGWITEAQLERSCKKVLLAKYWAGLHQYKPINLTNLTQDLNCCDTYLSIDHIIKEGLVVASNQDYIIPIENPELYKMACVSVGSNQFTAFQQKLLDYAKADLFSIDKNENKPAWDSLLSALSNYNLVVLSLHNTSRFVSKNLGLTPLQIEFINAVAAKVQKTILVCHGNPYIIRKLNPIRNVLVSFEDQETNNQLAAQVLFGAYKPNGVLPVTVNESFKQGAGIHPEPLHRFEYIHPEAIGIDPIAFSPIDTIVSQAIAAQAMPGAQVLIAKDGKVLYQKSFGYHTYDSLIPVQNHHLYDLASLTKILATTVAIMHLVDEEKIDLDAPISKYLPQLKGTNKADLKIADVLLHQAGLVPFVPFYKSTLVNGLPNPVLYSDTLGGLYTIPVAQNMYLHQDYTTELWQQIINTEVKEEGKYVYSDIGFILLAQVVESIGKMSFEQYVHQHIYKPLNLATMQFNPLLNGVNPDWIVPTECDSFFRMQTLDGTVHDQTAALLGGISGHAGLFANANDVAIIMQMLLNGGTYGNKRVLKEATVKEFTKRHQKQNRRGYGFDKPETDPKRASPAALAASPLAFGHTGFTGTCAWADPKNKTVYVFLSNRVHPSANNKKLVELNVRTRIQETMYGAVKGK